MSGSADLIRVLREDYGAHISDVQSVVFPNAQQRLMSYAIRKSHNSTVSYLLEKNRELKHGYGANGIDFNLDMILPPLVEAARMGNLELVRKLVMSGADIDKGTPNEYGITPLLQVCHYRHFLPATVNHQLIFFRPASAEKPQLSATFSRPVRIPTRQQQQAARTALAA